MYDESISLCFIIKDGASYLQRNVVSILQLAARFRDYRVNYVENDSTDGTKKILKEYETVNSRFRGMQLKLDGKHSTELCPPGAGDNCALRTNRLAFLRQRVLERALEYQSDVLVMLDMDFVSFDMNNFFRMYDHFLSDRQMDGIFGMSVLKSNPKVPYDIGAIRPCTRLLNILSEITLVSVHSAFSGFGVYRTCSIRRTHATYISPTSDIEHVHFNSSLDKLYVYPGFRPVYEGTSGLTSIFFFGNFVWLIVVLVIVPMIIICLLVFLVTFVVRRILNKNTKKIPQ